MLPDSLRINCKKRGGTMQKQAAHVAVLGTGQMGQPMVRRLLGAGFRVTVWNRTPGKAEALAADGATVAATPQDAVRGKDCVFTILTDGATVDHVLFGQGVATAMKPGGLLIDMSSIKPKEARSHAAALRERGVAHLDAPVSGGTRGAAAGSLAIMIGGEESDFRRALPFLAPLGGATHVGSSGTGQLAKLANQAIVAINIGGVAEALLLASAGGADPAAVRGALSGGFADSRILQEHGARMLERNFMPGGAIAIQIKDLENVLEAARECGVAMPVAEKMRDLFETVRDSLGGGTYDHSAALLAIEDMSKPNRLGNAPDQVP